MRWPENYSGATSDQHLIELWLSGRSEHTQRYYRRTAEEFLVFVGKPLQEVMVADAVRWAESLEGQPGTIACYVAVAKSLLSFAHKTGYTVFNVGSALRCPKVPNKLHERIVDEPAVQDMVKAAGQGRDRVMVRFLYASGARNSELCSLRWIDIKGCRVTLQGKGSKNRTIVMPKTVIDEVLALRPRTADDRDPVFWTRRGNPMNPAAVRFIVAQVAEEACQPVTPHTIRHAHASHSLNRGATLSLIQYCLGHANVATTSRYLHANPNEGSSQFLQM